MIRASLDEEKIFAELSEHSLEKYWRVRVLEETTSTQDELKNELVSNGQCVVAEYQSAGRGRMERSFQSERNVALLFSLFIKPVRSDGYGWISLIAGMSAAISINELTVIAQPHQIAQYKNKWPNDVVTDFGKIAGVLAERYNDGVIVGIGINVTTTEDELPVDTASSIYLTSGIEIDRNVLLAAVLKNFTDLMDRWERGENLIPRYRALSATIGEKVSISLPGGRTLNGVATNVDHQGCLVLDSGDRVSVGDVTHLRTFDQ